MNTSTKSYEEKIYHDYRAAIRLMRKAENGGGRTADRKQRALKSIADKHGIRIREVKQIVREHDELLEITHHHPGPYQQKLDYLAAVKEVEKQTEGLTICPQCSETPTKEGDLLRVRVNPFEVEIHDVLIPMFSCFQCYLAIADDI